jgi:hypothetical protein
MMSIPPSVRQLLQKFGPRLTSELSVMLQEHGASAANARKLIQRRDSTVKRLEVTFPHRAAFLFLATQKDSAKYWKNLLDAFRSTNSAFGFAIDSLKVRGGIVPVEYFHIVCGSPVALKGQLSSERVLNTLIHIGAVEVMPDPQWGKAVQLKQHITNIFEPSTARARLLAEDFTAQAVGTLIRDLGIGSHKKVEIRSVTKAPQFGAFKWDITAPSYLAPLRTRMRSSDTGKTPHGFFVADILLGRTLTAEDVRPFVRKNQIMLNQLKTRPFISMLVAERFSREALEAGKKPGFIMATTSSLFSQGVADAIKELVSVMTYAATAIVEDPQLVHDIFERLGALEGVAGSMRGPLFELWLARYLSVTDWHIHGVGRQFKDSKSTKRAEADVFASKNGEKLYLACEAKGITSPVSKEMIERWLNHQVPVIRAALLQRTTTGPPLDMVFEFWTTSSFSPDALSALQAASKRAKGYRLDWYDGKDIQDRAAKSKDEYLTKILNDFFLRNTASVTFEAAKERKKRIARIKDSANFETQLGLGEDRIIPVGDVSLDFDVL